MSEFQLPPGFTRWFFTRKDGPAGIDPETVVEVVQRNGDVARGTVAALDWEDDNMQADIMGWRVPGAQYPEAEPSDGPHPHAELMVEYAKDALTTREPWKLWQFNDGSGWIECGLGGPAWLQVYRYRRKPVQIPTQTINGFVVPKGLVQPLANKTPYYIASLESDDWNSYCEWSDDTEDYLWLERGIVFPTEAHAVAVAKAMCGIDPEWAQ